MTNKPKDFPFRQILQSVAVLISKGGMCFQKWTCDGCGKRLTSETPNLFTLMGRCDCGTITDLEKKGCNYMLAFAADPSNIEKSLEEMGLKPEAKNHARVIKL